ncbi:hypothetical protein B0H17DRAFT_1130455 [Mycena rosella]|uniref:Uncharacterized protein n=1 Tax=Mycena rosella TaxID=1033263 RepID=A0AAD7DR44_MYCRO|nr:hypothetical protein B0H17DRAFT_1130455 [Mycena rosella]
MSTAWLNAVHDPKWGRWGDPKRVARNTRGSIAIIWCYKPRAKRKLYEEVIDTVTSAQGYSDEDGGNGLRWDKKKKKITFAVQLAATFPAIGSVYMLIFDVHRLREAPDVVMFWLWPQAKKPRLFGFGTKAKAKPKFWLELAFGPAS